MNHIVQPSTKEAAGQYILPLKVYIWGGVMVLLGIVNIFFMVLKPESFLHLFFYSIPANTAISVFPHEPIVFFYGKNHNLLLIAAISSVSTLIAAYLDHSVFTPLLNHPKFTGYKHNRVYQKAIYYFKEYPFWTIVVAAFSPVPFWPIKMLAFSNKYPLTTYLFAVLVGRFPRYYLLAYAGDFMSLPSWVIWIIFAVVFIILLYDWLHINNAPESVSSSDTPDE